MFWFSQNYPRDKGIGIHDFNSIREQTICQSRSCVNPSWPGVIATGGSVCRAHIGPSGMEKSAHWNSSARVTGNWPPFFILVAPNDPWHSVEGASHLCMLAFPCGPCAEGGIETARP